MRYFGLSEKAIRRCFSDSLTKAIRRDYGKDEEAASLENNIRTKMRVANCVCDRREFWPFQHEVPVIWTADKDGNPVAIEWPNIFDHPKVQAKMRPKNRVYEERNTYSKKIHAA